MTRIAPLLALALAACEPMPSSGSPLEPVPATRAPRAPAPASADAELPPDPDSPFVEDQVFDAPPDPDAEPTGADVVFKAQLGNPTVPRAEPEPEPVPAAPEPPPAAAVWDGQAPPDGAGSWGVSLLATLLDVQPPRAVVALPDGTERVVQPGTFLPEHRLVILAVGRNAVQVAHIEPMGWNSRVQTQTLRSLFDR